MEELLFTENETNLRRYVLEIIPRTDGNRNMPRVDNAMSILSRHNENPDTVRQVVTDYMNMHDRLNLKSGLEISKRSEFEIFFEDTDNVFLFANKGIEEFLANTDIWKIGGFPDVVKEVGQSLFDSLGLLAVRFIDVLLHQIPALSAMAFHHSFVYCVAPAVFLTFALPLLNDGNFHVFLKNVRNACVDHARTTLCSFYPIFDSLTSAEKEEVKEAERRIGLLTLDPTPCKRETLSDRVLAQNELFKRNLRNVLFLGVSSTVVAGGILAFSSSASSVPSSTINSTLVMIGKELAEKVQISGRISFELVKRLDFRNTIATKAAEVAKNLLEIYKNRR